LPLTFVAGVEQTPLSPDRQHQAVKDPAKNLVVIMKDGKIYKSNMPR
jgi:hypothetical protein